MPLDGVRLTSDFGMRNHPVLGGYRMHKGIDLPAPSVRRSMPPPMAWWAG
jgi:murein DD-endopeptidase MepM/ murein hydrolase activator NlpD